jgi:uncharacterized membrane protein YjdF
VPEPWLFALLAALAFRLTRLVGWDDVTTRVRGWLGVTDATYLHQIEVIEEMEAVGEEPFSDRREAARWYLARLIRCPWCAGFWVSLLVALGAAACDQISWGWALPVGFALSAVVGLVAKQWDP